MGTLLGGRSVLGALLVGAVVLVTQPAPGQVEQNDGTPLPRPVSDAEIRLSDDLGWAADQQLWRDFDGNGLNPPAVYTDFFPDFVTGDAVTLEGLFKWRDEPLDPAADATTEPGYFYPGCEFSAELVLRGSNCALAFGWYNVADPTDPTPPAAGELYQLVPSNTEEHLSCMTQNGELQPLGTGFCPFGWDNHHPFNPPQLAWVPRQDSSGPLAEDPRYLGGAIAFALIGDPASPCRTTKHSLRAHNERDAHGDPWVTTLLYPSAIDADSCYLMFEDLPMSPEDWQSPGVGPMAASDGDFNDFVFRVSGVRCAGSGAGCATGPWDDCRCSGVLCPGGSECVAGVCEDMPSGGRGGEGGDGGATSQSGAATGVPPNSAGGEEQAGGVATYGGSSGHEGGGAPATPSGGTATGGAVSSGGTLTSGAGALALDPRGGVSGAGVAGETGRSGAPGAGRAPGGAMVAGNAGGTPSAIREASSDGGGCGCRTVGSRPGASAALLGGVLGALWRRRREPGRRIAR